MADAIQPLTTTAIMDAAAAAATKVHNKPDGGQAIVVPTGYRVHELPPLENPLTRIRANPVFHTAASFTAYVNRFKTDSSQLFAEPGFLRSDPGIVSAVVDYHRPPGDGEEADHCAHGADYMLRYSDQWSRWTGAGMFKQVEFAEFIEENRQDIRSPDAAQLLDMVRTFKASRKVEYDSVVYQSDGGVKLAYADTANTAGTSSAMPEKMQIGIPVYFRGELYSVDVWVRYKVGSGTVMFQLKVDRPDVIEDAAFNEVVGTIGGAVGIEAYIGRM